MNKELKGSLDYLKQESIELLNSGDSYFIQEGAGMAHAVFIIESAIKRGEK